MLVAAPLLDPMPTEDPPINTLYLAARASTWDEVHVTRVRNELLSVAKNW
ncbi:hypothetical protein [Actinoplanes utahensis]|nr:hypothetical protein [Actinoplanes utahensis]GIF31954.1 hypothetical protein Aut01nite_49400 [Actinoplanes utahensis]